MSSVSNQFAKLSETVVGPYKPGKSTAPVATRQLVDPVTAGSTRAFGALGFSPYADEPDAPCSPTVRLAGPVGKSRTR